MTKEDFIIAARQVIDGDSHYTGSGYRQFSEAELPAFVEHLYQFCLKLADEPDYTAPAFVLALHRAKQKYSSVQDIAAHLGEYVAEEKAKAAQQAVSAVKVP